MTLFSLPTLRLPLRNTLSALLLSAGLLAAPLRAEAQPLPCSTATPGVVREMRAVWLTTLSGLDWPRRPARTEAEAAQQRAALCDMLDRLEAAGINTVLFQSRIRSTTAMARFGSYARFVETEEFIMR